MHEFKFSGKGQVVTYSVVRDAPEGYELEVPYIVAIVQLEEGPRLTAPITYCDLDEIFIGMPVEVCFRKLREAGDHGIIIYGYKFRPIKEAKPK